uniref:Uncharacterized protein n=1 Tax=Gouania willdenowi TaxID=441366 RepID=A0A8C5GZJ9_GOUWI
MDIKLKEEQIRELELKVQELHKYKENEKDTEVLMSALSAMQDKTQHLENSLSAETRIKLDLFSALGRQELFYDRKALAESKDLVNPEGIRI